MRISVHDDLHPEDEAMLQALYSRSAAGVDTHIEKLRRTGSGKFMESFYVGYGHKSIGDCGTTTLFIEGVSLLAAKAIQNYPLYNGQETSTRYVDMLQQPIYDPLARTETDEILAEWLRLYTDLQAPVAAHVRSRYPMRPEEDVVAYDKAVRARTFDICRGFLPAGITTNLSWHVNLRQLGDRLNILTRHPLPEVRAIGEQIDHVAFGRYSHSRPSVLSARENAHDEYLTRIADDYYQPTQREWVWNTPETMGVFERVSGNVQRYFQERPHRAELPWQAAELGYVNFKFLLDFGSFRDLQRHRNGVCRMPLLVGHYGFHPWYVEQLPLAVIDDTKARIFKQLARIASLQVTLLSEPGRDAGSSRLLQYLYPLGMMVPCSVTYGIPALVYLLEMRTGKMVHPTLRQRALAMADWFEAMYEVQLYVDRDPDDFDVRRGRQDITVR